MEFPVLGRFSKYATLVLRVGLAIVILWFGVEQLTNASAWTTWVPEWTSVIGLSAEQIVYLNGTFEVVAGILLLFGFFTSIVSFLLFLHLLLIVFEIGIEPTGVRDFGLAVALLALSLYTAQKDTSSI